MTSYNEWHEGTQIEPARAVGAPYSSYDGAWRVRGKPAQKAYLHRTAWWTSRYAATWRGGSAIRRQTPRRGSDAKTTSAPQPATSAAGTCSAVDTRERSGARGRSRSPATSRGRASCAPAAAPMSSSASVGEDAAAAGLAPRDPLELAQLLERIDRARSSRCRCREGCRGARCASAGRNPSPRSASVVGQAHTRRAVRGEQVELRRRQRASRGRPWSASPGSRCGRAARSGGSRARPGTPRSRAAARRRGRGAAEPSASAYRPISSSQSAGQARTEWGATPTRDARRAKLLDLA